MTEWTLEWECHPRYLCVRKLCCCNHFCRDSASAGNRTLLSFHCPSVKDVTSPVKWKWRSCSQQSPPSEQVGGPPRPPSSGLSNSRSGNQAPNLWNSALSSINKCSSNPHVTGLESCVYKKIFVSKMLLTPSLKNVATYEILSPDMYVQNNLDISL